MINDVINLHTAKKSDHRNTSIIIIRYIIYYVERSWRYDEINVSASFLFTINHVINTSLNSRRVFVYFSIILR